MSTWDCLALRRMWSNNRFPFDACSCFVAMSVFGCRSYPERKKNELTIRLLMGNTNALRCLVLTHFYLGQYMLLNNDTKKDRIPVSAVNLTNITEHPCPHRLLLGKIVGIRTDGFLVVHLFDHSIVFPDITHFVLLLLSLFPSTARSASARVRRTERDGSGITSPSKCLTVHTVLPPVGLRYSTCMLYTVHLLWQSE